MLLFKLFLIFFEVGAVSFGGGYAMISLIRDKCLGYGWLSEESLMNFIAVAESTPGPIAVNMATFVGSSQAGILGSLVATLGIVLPSFVIILIIAAAFQNLVKYKGVQALLSGIKPVVIGLIIGTAITMFLSVVIGITTISKGIAIDIYGIIIVALLVLISFIYKKFKKKTLSPIALILFSSVCGIVFYL